MDDANDYVALHAVLTHGGFSEASRRLGVPKGTLSKRIARLEARLNVRLLERSTRSVRATEVGRTIFEHTRLIVAGLEASMAVAAGAQAEPNGLVRVSSPEGLIPGLLSEILPAFLRAYPKVDLQLDELNRPVDLVQDRVDLALRARLEVEADASMVVRRLGRTSGWLVASPAFLSTLDAPPGLDDVARLPIMTMPGDTKWAMVGPGAESRPLEVTPRLASSSLGLLRAATEAGLGIALLPEHICRSAMEAHTLVRVLPGWSTAQGTIYAVFSSRRGLTPALRALIDFLSKAVPIKTAPL